MQARVFIVDDHEEIRDMLRDVLEDDGHAVAEAADGLAALDVLRSSPEPLIVLLDLMMPRLDGIGVLREVAKDRRLSRKHAYVLMTAAQTTLPEAVNNLLPIITFLPKPFDVETVLETVEEVEHRLDVA